MKKFILAIASLIYLAVASGVVIATHYCMGKISGEDYTYRMDDKCSKCGMKNRNGCCHTEFKFVKLTDDQQQAKANIDWNSSAVELIQHTINYLTPAQGFEINRAFNDHAPPGDPGAPLYLVNSVFRI